MRAEQQLMQSMREFYSIQALFERPAWFGSYWLFYMTNNNKNQTDQIKVPGFKKLNQFKMDE